MDEIRIMCQTPIRLFYAFNNTHIVKHLFLKVRINQIEWIMSLST